jgi:hypothetical protein
MSLQMPVRRPDEVDFASVSVAEHRRWGVDKVGLAALLIAFGALTAVIALQCRRRTRRPTRPDRCLPKRRQSYSRRLPRHNEIGGTWMTGRPLCPMPRPPSRRQRATGGTSTYVRQACRSPQIWVLRRRQRGTGGISSPVSPRSLTDGFDCSRDPRRPSADATPHMARLF